MARVISEQSTATPVATDNYRSTDALNMAGRFVAVVAAAVPTIIGLIALAKTDWNGQGFDAPAVEVAGMTFRPWIAVATVFLGILAMAAAVSWDRESKIFTGAILVAIGIAIIVANPTIEAIPLTNRMGWMAIIVGGIIAAVGIIAGQTWASRRIRHRGSADYV
jgi:hypothetical protein